MKIIKWQIDVLLPVNHKLSLPAWRHLHSPRNVSKLILDLFIFFFRNQTLSPVGWNWISFNLIAKRKFWRNLSANFFFDAL